MSPLRSSASTFAFRKKIRIVLAICMLAILISVVSYVISGVFRIQNIEVVGEGISLVIDKEKMPNNLIFFPTQKITTQLLKDNPLISDVHIEKKFPQTLLIRVTRRPAIVKLRTDHQYLLIGHGAIVVGNAKDEHLPELQFPVDAISVGEIVGDERVARALQLIENSSAPIDIVSSWDSTSLKAKIGKTDIIVTQDSNIIKQATTLQTLMVGFRMKGLMPTHIDLRFEKPIVVF